MKEKGRKSDCQQVIEHPNLWESVGIPSRLHLVDFTRPPEVRALQDSFPGLAQNPFSVEELGSEENHF